MAKMKITNKTTGAVQTVTAAQAKNLKANPRFSKLYKFEEPAPAPAEIKKPAKTKAREPQQPPKTSAPREVG